MAPGTRTHRQLLYDLQELELRWQCEIVVAMALIFVINNNNCRSASIQ